MLPPAGRVRELPCTLAIPLGLPALPTGPWPLGVCKSQPVRLLEILQSPEGQQSWKLQYHVVRMSRYCWPSRGRLQAGEGDAVRQGQSLGPGGSPSSLPPAVLPVLPDLCPPPSGVTPLCSSRASLESCQGMGTSGRHWLCGSRWLCCWRSCSQGSVYSTNTPQAPSGSPRSPPLPASRLQSRPVTAGSHSACMLHVPKPSDHSRAQRPLNSRQMPV